MQMVPHQDVVSRDYMRIVEKAWERFIAKYPIDDLAVRAVVRDSWKRCEAAGVDPARKAAPSVVEAARLPEFYRRHSTLRDALDDSITAAMPFLNEARSVVILSEATGALVRVEGNKALAEMLQSSWIVPGAGWQEELVGTNAVGTALTLGRPVHIHGHEHFCHAGKAWSCTAMPFRDPVDRQVLGVVDFTGPAEASAAAAKAFVATLVERLEAFLVHQELEDRTRLMERFFTARIGSGPMIVVDRRGYVVKATDDIQIGGLPVRVGSPIPGLTPQPIELSRPRPFPEWIANDWVEHLDHRKKRLGGLIRLPEHFRAGNPRPIAVPPPPLPSSLQAVADASPSLLPLLSRARTLASAGLSLLILGETGTGKEVLAHAIHQAITTTPRPYVAINCAALPSELIGSELFGHAEGAFTGARRGGAKGKFEEADGGTIFLDEIGEMPIALQPYLLRVLEEGVVVRLGESRRRPVNVRLIAATNRPLLEAVHAGFFRADLFYRLAGASLMLPPLRERKEDLPALVHVLLRNMKPDRPLPTISLQLMAALHGHDWPGNIRELKNVLHQMVALSPPDNTLKMEHLQQALHLPLNGELTGPKKTCPTVKKLERDLILSAVRDAAGDVQHAAANLGLSRATVYRRLKKYGQSHPTD